MLVLMIHSSGHAEVYGVSGGEISQFLLNRTFMLPGLFYASDALWQPSRGISGSFSVESSPQLTLNPSAGDDTPDLALRKQSSYSCKGQTSFSILEEFYILIDLFHL